MVASLGYLGGSELERKKKTRGSGVHLSSHHREGGGERIGEVHLWLHRDLGSWGHVWVAPDSVSRKHHKTR